MDFDATRAAAVDAHLLEDDQATIMASAAALRTMAQRSAMDDPPTSTSGLPPRSSLPTLVGQEAQDGVPTSREPLDEEEEIDIVDDAELMDDEATSAS